MLMYVVPHGAGLKSAMGRVRSKACTWPEMTRSTCAEASSGSKSRRDSSASSQWCVFDEYHGACIITTTHGVVARSMLPTARLSHACCGEPLAVAQYEQSESTSTGPTAREYHSVLAEPEARKGIG